MPAKKRPSKKAPDRARRKPAKSAPARSSPATDVTVAAARQGGPSLLVTVVVIGALAVIGLAWWMIKRGQAPLPPEQVAAQPAPAPAAAPAAPMSAPAVPAQVPPAPKAAPAAQGRDVAGSPAAAPAPSSSKPEGQRAHREQAGSPQEAAAEDSDGLVLKLSSAKAIQVRCWRSSDAPARLDIFGPHNHLVRSVLSDPGDAGWQELSWNGASDGGTNVDPGSYILRPTQKGDQVILYVRVKN